MANNMNGGGPGFTGFDPTAGVNSIQNLTLFSGVGGGGGNSTTQASAAQTVTSSPASANGGTSFAGEPLAVWIGFIFLLLIIKFFSERPKSNLNPAHIKIGGLNILTIGVSAGIFIILMKVIFNHFKVYGFTDFANAL